MPIKRSHPRLFFKKKTPTENGISVTFNFMQMTQIKTRNSLYSNSEIIYIMDYTSAKKCNQ